MGNIVNKDECLRQNLIDAGCTSQQVAECMNLSSTQLNDYLIGYRKNLLNQLHVKQQQIDCLDYLLFNLSKGEKENESNSNQWKCKKRW